MENLILWSEELSVGISEIDEQHKKMFSIINDLFHAIKQSATKERIQTIIDELVSYADYHFSTEEKYFADFQYEGTEEHKQKHVAYKETVARFENEFSKGDILLPMTMLDFLEDWWIGHISSEDRKYIACFKENGLSS